MFLGNLNFGIHGMFKYKNDHYDVYIENQLSISPVTSKYVTVDSYEALNR